MLLDPIPPINKVFSLVAQEERQRTISSQLTYGTNEFANSMAFVARNEPVKKPNNDGGHSGGNRFQKDLIALIAIFKAIQLTDVTSCMVILLGTSRSRRELQLIKCPVILVLTTVATLIKRLVMGMLGIFSKI